MKNSRASETLCIAISLTIWTFCGGLQVAGQATTLALSSTLQATTQASPKEESAEAKALIAEFQAPQQLLDEGLRLYKENKMESLLAARAKLTEAVEASRRFHKKLEDENLSNVLTDEDKTLWKMLIKSNEVNALIGLSNVYFISKEWPEAVEYNKRATATAGETLSNTEIRASKYFDAVSVGLKLLKASALRTNGSILKTWLDKSQESLGYFNQALILLQEIKGDKKYAPTAIDLETITLLDMAQAYRKLDNRPKALEYYGKSLALLQELSDHSSQEMLLLLEIGVVYSSLLDYEKALENWNKALKIADRPGNEVARAMILTLIGSSYTVRGKDLEARQYYNRVLTFLLSPGYLESRKKMERSDLQLPPEYRIESPDLPSFFTNDLYESQRFVQIGLIYYVLKEYGKSIKYFEKGLSFARSTKSHGLIQQPLSLLGRAYVAQKKWGEAIQYYEQSLKLSRKSQRKSDVASDLSDLGYVYLQSGDLHEAKQNLDEARLIYKSLGAAENNLFQNYSTTLFNLARTYHALDNPRLAITLGKQAVEGIQQERRMFQTFDQDTQKSYLKNNLNPYRQLMVWLYDTGRIPEGYQLYKIIKERELRDYVRSDDKVANDLKATILLTPAEKEAFNNYDKLAGDITRISAELRELDAKIEPLPRGKSLSVEEQEQYDELKKRLDDAVAAFNTFFNKLKMKFEPNDEHITPNEANIQGLLKRLNQPRTVVISTILGEDHLKLIVTSIGTQRVYTVNIKAAALNKLIAEFRAAVMNSAVNPRRAGKKLFRALFPQGLQEELKVLNTDTLIWSLDGTLRYVPIAALWDGKKYLVERYTNALITLASFNKLNAAPSNRTTWHALGVGVSKEATVRDTDGRPKTFSALKAVPEELCGIVADPKKKEFCAALGTGKIGVIPGINLLDSEFNLQSFQELLGRASVVHIATHLSLNAGTEIDSYLLLGGGEERRFSFANLKTTNLTNVELLTLSACDTAISSLDTANGMEIESFGALAQNRGAKSVLATLWSVADPSTRDLMIEFYRILETDHQIGKAEALRRAQLSLLQGKSKTRDIRETKAAGIMEYQLPSFKHAENTSYAHPYFWSPFVLTGNWQ